jgi:hypothetical protein
MDAETELRQVLPAKQRKSQVPQRSAPYGTIATYSSAAYGTIDALYRAPCHLHWHSQPSKGSKSAHIPQCLTSSRYTESQCLRCPSTKPEEKGPRGHCTILPTKEASSGIRHRPSNSEYNPPRAAPEGMDATKAEGSSYGAGSSGGIWYTRF